MLHPTKNISLDMYVDEFTGMWHQKLLTLRDNDFQDRLIFLPSVAA